MHSSIPSNTNRGARHGPARRPAAVRIAHAAAIAALILLTGCNAMSSPQEAGMELAVKIDTSKPIKFSAHSFGAHCFEATECRVSYSNRLIRSGEQPQRPIPYPAGDISRRLVAPHIGIPNFPGPAQVSWRALDGTPLLAEVDIGDIFKDQVIRHQTPKEQIPPHLFAPVEPEILIVVRDRSIEIFMRAHMPTVDLQVPGNPHSDFRSDLVLVHNRNY